MSSIKTGNSSEKVWLNVNDRPIEIRPGTKDAVLKLYADQDLKLGSGNFEIDMLNSALANYRQAVVDGANCLTSFVNAVAGIPESAFGVVYGVLGNIDDVAWTAYFGLKTASEKVAFLNSHYEKNMDEAGLTAGKKKEIDVLWKTFTDNAKDIIDGKEWKVFEDGVNRLGRGVLFTGVGADSFMKNILDGSAELSLGLTYGIPKALAVGTGKLLGLGLEYLGGGIKQLGDWVGSGGNTLEEAADQVYQKNPDFSKIEKKWDPTK